jgi:hypothetical protein
LARIGAAVEARLSDWFDPDSQLPAAYVTLTAEMRFFEFLRDTVLLGCVFAAGLGLYAHGREQAAQSPVAQEEPAGERKGMPPRIAPTEYQVHGMVGDISIAADFDEHSVPTPEGTFTSEDYVVVEAALFGPPGARIKLAAEDFSLRINDRKAPYTSQGYALLFHSLSDPEWQPPKTDDSEKSKTSIGGGGRGQNDPPPSPPKMPRELRRAMELKVQKVVMPEGDRALPIAGLLFFQYHGRSKGIKSMELVYSGAAGKVSIPLHP